MAAYVRLKTKRGQWMYAPDSSYGSDYYLQKKRRTDQDQTFIENVGARALTPIVNDGRASEIEVDAVSASRTGVGLSVKITDARTQIVQEIKLPSV
jgi:phage gp46-like protein